MSIRIHSFLKFFKIAVFVCAPLFLFSCASGGSLSEPRGVTISPMVGGPSMHPIQKVLVINFCDSCNGTVLHQPNICPLTGIHFISGSVMPGSGEIVADQFRKFLAQKGFSVVDNKEIATMGQKLHEQTSLELAIKLAKTVEADAVITGSVMRYEERVGSRFSVDKPASIGFSVAVISVKNGTILWKAKFAKTQRALLSNVLDFRTFTKGGMVWQKAGQLSNIGVQNILETLPFGPAALGTR